MYYIGIDIGSTCAKTVVMDESCKIVKKILQPTGWSSVDTADQIGKSLELDGISFDECKVVATGYGRVSVPYADKQITEITCHARGASWLADSENLVVIDIGGQDTKVIKIENKMVKDFIMNDKCSAGTGRFLEVMGNTMALSPDKVCQLARKGSGVQISSMCTVFAESEVISLVGRGEKKENIAYAVVESIASKVVSQSSRVDMEGEKLYLTGGLCQCDFLKEMLEKMLGKSIQTSEDARYAGAIGAALSAAKL